MPRTFPPVRAHSNLAVLGLILAFAIVLLGTGGAGAGLSRIQGGTPAEQALLRSVVASLYDTSIRGVTITQQPAQAAGNTEISGNSWLTIDAAPADREASFVKSYWQAALVAGAFHRIASDRGFPDIIRGFSLDETYPGGATDEDSSFVRDLGAGTAPADTAAFAAHVNAKARQEHLTVLGISFGVPAGPAAEVTLATSTPASFAPGAASHVASVLGDTTGLDGVLVRVVDAKQNVILTSGYANSAGTGARWVAPAFSKDLPSR
jgi:hypothetical protein